MTTEKTHSMDSIKGGSGKKAYQPPHLTVYGNVQRFTTRGSRSGTRVDVPNFRRGG